MGNNIQGIGNYDKVFNTEIYRRLWDLEKKYKKLLESGGGGSANVENGLQILGSGKIGLGGLLTEDISTITIPEDKELRIGNEDLSVGFYFYDYGLFCDVYRPPGVTDNGYAYIDFEINTNTGVPYLDIWFEGSPGQQKDIEMLFEPGYLYIYTDDDAVIEFDGLQQDDASPWLLALNASGNLVRADRTSIGGGGGGGTLAGTPNGIQAPGDNVLYSAPHLNFPVDTGKVTKFEFFIGFYSGSSAYTLSTKLLWSGAGAVPAQVQYNVIMQYFPFNGAGTGNPMIVRKCGTNANALGDTIVWDTDPAWVNGSGGTLRIFGTIHNRTGSNGNIQFQYATVRGLGDSQLLVDNGSSVEYNNAAVADF